MSKQQTEAIYGLVTMLAECFGRKISEPMLRAYANALEDLPPDKLADGFLLAIRRCKFMPTVHEIRKLAGVGEQVDLEERAIIAWSHVQRASRYGSYKSVNFDDPAINAAIRNLGGWPAILAKTTEDFDIWVRKDFCRTYEAILRQGVIDESESRPLAGLGDDGGQITLAIDGTFTQHVRKEPIEIKTQLTPLVEVRKQPIGISQTIEMPKVELSVPPENA